MEGRIPHLIYLKAYQRKVPHIEEIKYLNFFYLASLVFSRLNSLTNKQVAIMHKLPTTLEKLKVND